MMQRHDKFNMLEIRPTCENCNKDLLNHVCPNCGGGFEKRPVRPAHLLKKYPVSKVVVHKPVDINAHLQILRSK
jgi:hypothetical protein